MLVVVEGVTCAGKTTVCKKVCDLLRKKGIEAVDMNEILERDQTLLAIRKITHPSSSLLTPLEELFLYSVRLVRKSTHIKRLLLEKPNSIVLIDRFAHSVIVFSEAVRNMGRDLVKTMVSSSIKGLSIDLLVVLEVSLAELRNRERINATKRSRKHLKLESYFDTYIQGLNSEYSKWKGKKIKIDTSKLTSDTVASLIVSEIIKLHKGGKVKWKRAVTSLPNLDVT